MKKNRLITAIVAAMLLAPAIPIAEAAAPSQLSTITTAAAAKTKVASKARVVSAINRTADLNPTGAVMTFNQPTYEAYGALFDKQYNVGAMSSWKVFGKHNRAYVYTNSSALQRYVTGAIKNWNRALGQKAFVQGTKAHHTITIQWQYNGASLDWDGLYANGKLKINKSLYDDPTYVPQSYEAENKTTMPGANDPNSAAYQQQASKYWTAITTHELGHSLGLDHSPYTSDIMYTDSETAGSTIKYGWQQGKNTGSFAEFTNTVSQRDINRAKLAENLGYW
ncbi:MAG: matrixin family metalloprotease [Lentilactobacillus diolivorans]|jgi:predicted Zn-dependent protease|nr:matrixin family metalloprotease [Lentilactobacillus diolivorans]RRG02597.1 MAG: hypothetical protein DUD34_07830 [Lactobacillus sp.]